VRGVLCVLKRINRTCGNDRHTVVVHQLRHKGGRYCKGTFHLKVSKRSVAMVLYDVYHVLDINSSLKAGNDMNYIERFSTYRAVHVVRFSCNI